MHGGAEFITTHNLKDFPADILAAHNLIAERPDAFVCRLINGNP